MQDASDHMFQYSIVPLRIEQESEVLWKNPTPNAATPTQPLFLIRAAEDEERVLDLVIPTTDIAREQLKNSIEVKIKTVIRIHLQSPIQFMIP